MNRTSIVMLILLFSGLIVTFDSYAVCDSESQGLLIITRDIFADSFSEFIEWKNSMGFEVYVVTAEWIQENVDGNDLRIQIRNCIRQHYYDLGVKYVMLVGDSVDTTPEEAMATIPQLSEDWNLPIACYLRESYEGEYEDENKTTSVYQCTNLFYSDLSNKTLYTLEDMKYGYVGDYGVYVGIVPVRTEIELQNILEKTMNYCICSKMSITYSYDAYVTPTLEIVEEFAGSKIQVNSAEITNSSTIEEIHEKIFRTEGVIYESGHGNQYSFRLGNKSVTLFDAHIFEFVNPLMLMRSCSVGIYYQVPETITEAFLRAEKGPVVIISAAPTGGVYLKDASDMEKRFWADLFSGKTIGQALFDNLSGAIGSTAFLFGDPSSVIFEDTGIQKSIFDVTVNGDANRVIIISNSTISAFQFDDIENKISFNMSEQAGKSSFCFISLPTSLMGTDYLQWQIEINDNLIMSDSNNFAWGTDWSGNKTSLSFTYTHGVADELIPEFPSWIILTLFVTAALVVIIYKKEANGAHKTEKGS